jgi:hypothetical protein
MTDAKTRTVKGSSLVWTLLALLAGLIAIAGGGIFAIVGAVGALLCGLSLLVNGIYYVNQKIGRTP